MTEASNTCRARLHSLIANYLRRASTLLDSTTTGGNARGQHPEQVDVSSHAQEVAPARHRRLCPDQSTPRCLAPARAGAHHSAPAPERGGRASLGRPSGVMPAIVAARAAGAQGVKEELWRGLVGGF
jgi:hypothetical protein